MEEPEGSIPDLAALAEAAAAAAEAEQPNNRRASSIDTTGAQCWGAQLRGTEVRCTPGFVRRRGHFKNKFCAACVRGSFELPERNVYAVLPDVLSPLTNSQGEGFWNSMLPPSPVNSYRFVNNTRDCTGPCLIVFQDPPSPPFDAGAPLPAEWIDERGIVTLRVTKGTLTPKVNYPRQEMHSQLQSQLAPNPVPTVPYFPLAANGASGCAPRAAEHRGPASAPQTASSRSPLQNTLGLSPLSPLTQPPAGPPASQPVLPIHGIQGARVGLAVQLFELYANTCRSLEAMIAASNDALERLILEAQLGAVRRSQSQILQMYPAAASSQPSVWSGGVAPQQIAGPLSAKEPMAHDVPLPPPPRPVTLCASDA